MPNFLLTKVDPDRLKITADNISQSISSIIRAFQTIDTAVTALGAFWTGPASEQYFKQYMNDKEFFNTNMNVLTTFNDQLRQAAGIFDGADAKAREQVNQLKIG